MSVSQYVARGFMRFAAHGTHREHHAGSQKRRIVPAITLHSQDAEYGASEWRVSSLRGEQGVVMTPAVSWAKGRFASTHRRIAASNGGENGDKLTGTPKGVPVRCRYRAYIGAS